MDTETAREKLIFALDVADGKKVIELTNLLYPHVGVFKVGLEGFMSQGPEVIRVLRHFRPVMLDLKLHDIPETVGRAVAVAGDLGVKFLTLHVQQGETLMKAVEVAEKYPGMTLLGVTMLTSMDEGDLYDLCMGGGGCSLRERVLSLAHFAYDYGIHGFVCSPQEAGYLRMMWKGLHHPPAPIPILVTPGIRATGANLNDHKRQSSAGEAIKNGADYIVVGRPIRDAPYPDQAARAIVEEIVEAHAHQD